MFNLLPSAPRMLHLIHADYQEEQGNLLFADVIRQGIERIDNYTDDNNHINDNYGGEGNGLDWGNIEGEGAGYGSGNGSGSGWGAGSGCGSGNGCGYG